MKAHALRAGAWYPLEDHTDALAAGSKLAKGWVRHEGAWVPFSLKTDSLTGEKIAYGWVRHEGVWVPIMIPKLPGQPSNLRMTARTHTTITVSWDPSSRTDEYKVTIGANAPVVVTGTTHQFTGLAASTTYTISVTSVNEHGEAPPVSIQVATSAPPYVPPPPPSPAPPTWVQITKTGPSTGLLQWGNNGYWGYSVAHIIKEGDAAHSLTETPDAYSGMLEVRNAHAGHTNTYRVRFQYDGGYWTDWTYSNWVTWG